MKTRQLVEGSILIALYAVLLLIFLYVPLINLIGIFALPIPFVVYVYRNGKKNAVLFYVVSLLVTYIVGTLLALPATLLFGGVGLILGYNYRKHKDAFSILISGSLSFTIGFILVYVGSILFFELNPAEETQKLMQQSMKLVEGFTGMGQQDEEQYKMFYDMVELLPSLVPSAIVLTSILMAWFTQLLCNMILSRLGGKIKPFPPFREIKFPKSILWYYLLSSLFYFIGFDKGTTLFDIVINLFIILEFVMTIQGLAFIYYYCYVKEIKKAVPIFITVFALLIPILLYLIRILGIIDLGFDLRKRVKQD